MSWDGNTISCGPPMREDEGFGCSSCGAPLPTDGVALRRAAIFGMPCCGYWMPGPEARRLALAGQLLEATHG